jgi:hypothetical protein
MSMAEMITFREGVLEALFEEMRADPSVILMGEDVGAAGGVFQQTKGLFEEFGARRIIDTPISESGAFGMAIGAAMAGMRPVFEVMFGDFMTLCMDQLVNQAAKVRYMSNGAATVPLVLRPTMGVDLLLPLFAAVILGGVGSIWGAVLGGFIVGLSESVAVTLVGAEYRAAAAFVVLIAILMLRPRGLFGETH